tara:strand:- start:8503 stop:9498 length:996 start_codon:yes stop_codon:yes gene_type:complete
MSAVKYIFTVALLLAVAFLYEKFKHAQEMTDPESDYQIVRKYLLGGQEEAKPGKPIIWIHADSDINARWWPSFGSRNTRCSNQPYELLTVTSIVDKCKDDFSICVVQDKDIPDLVPGWTADLRKIAEPIRGNMRRLALARLLHKRGGLLVPSTFLAFRSLKPMYESACRCPGGMVVCELQTKMGRGPPLSEPGAIDRQPRTEFMGCKPESGSMYQYASLLERICSTDCTAESAFLGEEEEWCKRTAGEGMLTTVPPELVGVHDAKGAPIGIERLLGSTYIPLCSRAFGLYVPAEQVRRRTSYSWFSRQSSLQAMGSDTALGKYLLVVTSER